MFTQSPYGFVKGSKPGHHLVARTPQSADLNKIKGENEELRQQLAALQGTVAELVDAASSGKKKGK